MRIKIRYPKTVAVMIFFSLDLMDSSLTSLYLAYYFNKTKCWLEYVLFCQTMIGLIL